MARTGVTYEQVKALLDQDPDISTTEIRDRLKTGSLGTITIHRRKWLEEARGQLKDDLDWPKRIRIIAEEVQEQTKKQREVLTAEIELLRSDASQLAKENESLSDRIEEAEAEADRSQREAEVARRELARAEVRLEEYPKRISTLEEELAAERDRGKTWEIRTAVLEASVERLEREVVDLRKSPEPSA